MPADRLTLTELQEEGARQATAIMLRYGGVIVADSVGMGKTYLALRMIASAIARGRSVIVVVPATLRYKWRAALVSAGLAVASASGSPVAGRVLITSHSLVHRVGTRWAPDRRLVVVDEAHQFRNPRTARYRALARITAHADVVLLTATPINNGAADLYWLLRLFLGDGALRDAGIPDLRTALLSRDGVDDVAMQRIAGLVVVRRTRREYRHEGNAPGLRFPRRHAPRAIPYVPSAAEIALLRTIEATLPRLRLSAFDVQPRPRTAGSRNTSMLIRFGLLKRAESSPSAFRASLLRLLRFLDAFSDAVAGGGYVRAADVHVSDPLQLSLTPLILRRLPRTADPVRLADDAAHDRDLISRLVPVVARTESGKMQALEMLLHSLGDARRVVFTEYAETAEALFASLPRANTALLHGGRAALASGTASRRAVLEGFAPRACGARKREMHEAVHTLISTDVLAEGLDLQDANHCISYDLPWNPVRLMQRAGRIDRLGSPHADVYVWYFEPRTEIERWLGLVRRLGMKLQTISHAIGAEHGAVGAEHNAVGAQHNAVGAQHNAVGAQHNAVGAQHNALDAQHNAVGAQHNALDAQHNAVGAQHVPIQAGQGSRQAKPVAAPAHEVGGTRNASESMHDATGAALDRIRALLDSATLSPATAGSASPVVPDAGPPAEQPAVPLPPAATVFLCDADFDRLLRDASSGSDLPAAVRSAERLLLACRRRDGVAWLEATLLGRGSGGSIRGLEWSVSLAATARIGQVLCRANWAEVPAAGRLLLQALGEAAGSGDTCAPDASTRGMADLIRTALLRGGPAVSTDLFVRADLLLERLQTGVPAGVAVELARLRDSSRHLDIRSLLSRIESTLLPHDRGKRCHLVAALLVCRALDCGAPDGADRDVSTNTAG